MVSLLLSVVAISLAACGSGVNASTGLAALTGPALVGTVSGGREAISGSTVQVYAAGANGSESTALLPTPVTTDSNGTFAIPEGYACPSASAQVYLTSTGGNPGLALAGQNPTLSLMTALGTCGSLQNSRVSINEVTTVASVWALALYMKSSSAIGAESASQTQLASAFSSVHEFVDPATGSAPGPALPTGSAIPLDKLNTLADILATCVQSPGGTAGDRSACGNLFTASTPAGGVAPVNVVDAALDIARNPAWNVSQLYNLPAADAPFTPVLSAAPSDWLLPVSSSVDTPVLSPDGGSFTGSEPVTISDATASTEIHYTVDGSIPTASSPLYTGPLTITSSLTLQAIAFLGQLRSNDASSSFFLTPGTAAQLVFGTQPSDSGIGESINPAVSVLVEDASGNILSTATNPVTMSLAANPADTALNGTLAAAAVDGEATFGNLQMNTPGTGYQLAASSPGLAPALSAAFTVVPPLASATFTPPPANACQSKYDKFYIAEPGVYAFWALCEPGMNSKLFDYAGQWGLDGGWGTGPLVGGAPGPVADGETAVRVPSAAASIQKQDIPLNGNAGTIATWINTDATDYPISAVWFAAVGHNSSASIAVKSTAGAICFTGNWHNAANGNFSASHCGYAVNSWHRVVFTWSAGLLDLYVDGVSVATANYSGSFDNTVFYYKLFPGCCDTGRQMTLAKALVANQAWSAAQVASDLKPALLTPPSGGVYVTTQALGTIHRDVLGFADDNQDISSPALVSALKTGLTAGGFTSLRYAGGFGGITADLEDWRGGPVACGSRTAGKTMPAQNIATADNITNYVTEVAQPLGLHLGYTVNYGTNAPLCNAGGDPIVNGANLVDFLNNQKHFGFRYFEIGNEQYSTGSETDLHPNPQTGASYSTYEPAFYDAMKAKDPTIQIAVPIGGAGIFDVQTKFDFPVLTGAKYDAIVFHAYPLQDPITDGSTLYQDRVASPTNIRGPLLTVQTELLNAGRSPESIWITEWSGSVGGGKWSRQSMGAVTPLFVASQLAEFMQAGVQYATWWAQGMTDVCSTYNYDGSGESAYSWWGCGSTALTYTGAVDGVGEMAVGLKPGDLTPAARGFQVIAQSGFVLEGEHMLRTQTDSLTAPWLLSYAATHAGSYAVMLINRDRDQAHTVPVQLAGMASGSTVNQWTYGRAQYDQTFAKNWSAGPVHSTHGTWTGSFQATLPPWSVNIFIVSK